MKKFACTLGIILSLALVALGVLTLVSGLPILDGSDIETLDYSGTYMDNTSFGADFYTYSYRATRAAGNNVRALGDFLEDGIASICGIGMAAAGLFGLLLSFYGLGAAKDSARRLELLDEIANTTRAAAQQQKALEQIASNGASAIRQLQALKELAADDSVILRQLEQLEMIAANTGAPETAKTPED